MVKSERAVSAVTICDSGQHLRRKRNWKAFCVKGLASGSSELDENEFEEVRAELARRIAHREKDSCSTVSEGSTLDY